MPPSLIGSCQSCENSHAFLRTVLVDPETCEPTDLAGGNGQDVDLQPVLDCLEEMKDLLVEISIKLCGDN